jgi:hypothetical protein
VEEGGEVPARRPDPLGLGVVVAEDQAALATLGDLACRSMQQGSSRLTHGSV